MYILEIFSWNKGRKFASQVEHVRTVLRNRTYTNKDELELVQPLALMLLTIVKKVPKQWQHFFNEHFVYSEEQTQAIIKGKIEITHLVKECVTSRKDVVRHVQISKSTLIDMEIMPYSLETGEIASFNKHTKGAITLSIESINKEVIICRFTFHCSKT